MEALDIRIDTLRSLVNSFDDHQAIFLNSLLENVEEKSDGTLLDVYVINDLLDERFCDRSRDEIEELMLKSILKFSKTDEVALKHNLNVLVESTEIEQKIAV